MVGKSIAEQNDINNSRLSRLKFTGGRFHIRDGGRGRRVYIVDRLLRFGPVNSDETLDDSELFTTHKKAGSQS